MPPFIPLLIHFAYIKTRSCRPQCIINTIHLSQNCLSSLVTALSSAHTPFGTLAIFLFRMRVDFSFWLLLGLAAAHAIERRDNPDSDDSSDDSTGWRPHTHDPHFFNLRIDDKCDQWGSKTKKWQCPFDSYAIRLEKGIVVATPYNKWWDPKLPTFFVDDDTQLYTVSGQSEQYINTCAYQPIRSARSLFKSTSIALLAP